MRLLRFGIRTPDTPDYARALQEIGPAAIKLGQALSTRPDLVGPKAADNLSRLQDDLPPAPFATIRQAIETLARVGPFDPALKVSNDTDWFARARDAGVIHGVLPETYVHKRIHGANASLTDGAINAQLLQLLRHSIERKRERGVG